MVASGPVRFPLQSAAFESRSGVVSLLVSAFSFEITEFSRLVPDTFVTSSSGGRQEVYLVNGSTKTLVYSKLETKQFLDESNSKDVAEKIKGMVSS